ncbi:MAG: CapA family protein [Clostridia bacterium]|nr:CapA family protein [Clostridia bacterium]
MTNKRKKRRLKPEFKLFCAVLAVLVIGISVFAVNKKWNQTPSAGVASSSGTSQESVTSKEKEPITVTLGCTGDILIHNPILKAYAASGYDFNDMFRYVQPYFTKYDYMVANLEVTLGGESKSYRGYPTFNTPDTIVEAAKQSGIDMLLTANNHSYDTGKDGFFRTLEVLDQKQIEHIGTRTETDSPYFVKDINGIKFGMVNYTYETQQSNGRKTLNGIAMHSDTENLINSFNYSNLDAFYSELSDHISAMKSEGAEAIILYIHWGNEYKLEPSSYQKTMAKRIADLGVDVIVGGHPHVVEPIEILQSEVTGKQTVCLYSLGNAVSNQRISFMNMKTGHTEDGMIFETTFVKKPDGSVILDKINVVPIWVNMHTDSSKHYHMLPLDKALNWQTDFGISQQTAATAQKSYERTMALVNAGLSQFDGEYKKIGLNSSGNGGAAE